MFYTPNQKPTKAMHSCIRINYREIPFFFNGLSLMELLQQESWCRQMHEMTDVASGRYSRWAGGGDVTCQGTLGTSDAIFMMPIFSLHSVGQLRRNFLLPIDGVAWCWLRIRGSWVQILLGCWINTRYGWLSLSSFWYWQNEYKFVGMNDWAIQVSCVGVVTRPRLRSMAEETAWAAPMLCAEDGSNGWMDGWLNC